MYYVTGDTHGDATLWTNHIIPLLQKGDTILVAGDFGVGGFREHPFSWELFLDYLANQEFTVLFCDGNHENFDKLNAFPVSEWHGGKVHFLRENVIHLIRGEIYDINGKHLFVFGGGYSLDRMRRTPGINWWAEEMPVPEEYERARRNLEQYHNHVDYILTHTAPCETVEYLVTYGVGIHKNVFEEYPLTSFLQEVQSTTAYDKWYFGHFHVDREVWRNQYALLDDVRELETGKSIFRRL